jgi:hypothetical protein
LQLLPVDYYHRVVTLPAVIADIAYQNKPEVYAIVFRAAAEILAKVGVTMVLHS